MNKEQIITIIERRIKEHQEEFNNSEELLEVIKTKNKVNKPTLETLQELAVNKDRAMFHKVAVNLLKDLKKEIESV